MRVSFGTDGVRGRANTELTPELVLLLGRAAARVIGAPRFLVGRDTRISGPLLQAALSAGLASEGADVVDLGVIPTPAVAALAADAGAAAVVVSASHNPFPDNGIKVFAVGGTKLDDAVERRIEDEVAAISAGPESPRPDAAAVGRMVSDPGAAGRYLARLAAALEGRRLDGLRVVVDCANGAASAIAGPLLEGLGAVVVVHAASPDGTNINDGCGSTDPGELARLVVENGADAGLALDGDADRVVAVDENGALVDGDHVMALCAVDLRRRGLLRGDTVAVTVMTNLGFRRAMEAAGIEVHETPVGDRYIFAALTEHDWVLGGEPSGHVILRHLAPSGDGLLTGLVLLDLVVRSGASLGRLAGSAMTRMPQVLRNVRVADLSGLAGATAVWDAVRLTEERLAGKGRVLLRASGTEPLVRVMVEADDEGLAQATAGSLCEVVEQTLGAARA
ncbi:MAG TPA: phosphoglucosamine mutase [Acidimicrobiales bacterium]|nr:phosphoglucosamine mutase [Acidimicrobiales bacterium]